MFTSVVIDESVGTGVEDGVCTGVDEEFPVAAAAATDDVVHFVFATLMPVLG